MSSEIRRLDGGARPRSLNERSPARLGVMVGATEQAKRLVPEAVLQGCRRALQRIGPLERISLGVTSAVRGEGRSTVALGLALVQWLDHERRTVLVDLDLERPSLHERVGLAAGPGIHDLIPSGGSVDKQVRPMVGDIWLLSSGETVEDYPRALSRLTEGSALTQIAEWAEAVIFDLPPILDSPTGLDALRLCGSPVMVVRAGVTPLPRVLEAMNTLTEPPPVILNGVRSSLPQWIRRRLG
jgi:Mrp family chromosome partitioning ATPase